MQGFLISAAQAIEDQGIMCDQSKIQAGKSKNHKAEGLTFAKNTAKLLGLHPESIRRLIRSGELQAYKIPPNAKRPTYRVPQNAIDGFLAKCNPETFKPLPRKSSRRQDTVPDWVSTLK